MKICLIILTFLSPLWPLGENPTPVSPFLIVNKATNQLAYVNQGEVKTVFPVATGKQEEDTPEGMFMVTFKTVNPAYTKRNIPGGAKENPLGSRWIGFDARNTNGRTFGVHGTNRPASIGRDVSSGCIRMLNRDVESLYQFIPPGTRIYITSSAKSFEQLAQEQGAIKTENYLN